MAIDKHIGSSAKLYSSLAPTLAPLAKELLGEGKSSIVHQAISDGLSNYENVKGKSRELTEWQAVLRVP